MKLEENIRSHEPFQLRPHRGSSVLELTTLALALLWLLVSVFLFFLNEIPGDSVLLIQLLVIFIPVAMICLCFILMRTTRVMQEEVLTLQTSIDALRKTYTEQSKRFGNSTTESAILKNLGELNTRSGKIESSIQEIQSELIPKRSAFTSIQTESEDMDAEDQSKLELGTSDQDRIRPISVSDYIRALNFPENEDDKEGFAALRAALQDREASLFVQSAQDILTLLSQDGVYMDDLRPDVAGAEVWRRFAHGERGHKISSLGGIRERSALALANGRMKQDSVFRDTAHHFLRTFDKRFTAFETFATDADIEAFSQTRTARAFMLLGRVAGTFD